MVGRLCLTRSPGKVLADNAPGAVERVSDRNRADQVDRLWKVSRVTPDDFAYLVAWYLEFPADYRAKERVDERFVIRIGEGVEPDEALHAYVEPCFFFDLSSGGSCRGFARLDPPTGRADRTFSVRRPGEQDASVVVEDDRDGDGDRVKTHRRKLLEPDPRPRLGRPAGSEDARLSEAGGPGQCAAMRSGPLPRRTYRSAKATRIASSR